MKLGIEEAKTKALAEIVREKETDKFVTQDFDRYEEHFINLYKGKLHSLNQVCKIQSC